MILAYNQGKKNDFIVDSKIFSQTLDVLKTRAKPLGINIIKIDLDSTIALEEFTNAFGLLVQLPDSNGRLKYHEGLLRLSLIHI